MPSICVQRYVRWSSPKGKPLFPKSGKSWKERQSQFMTWFFFSIMINFRFSTHYLYPPEYLWILDFRCIQNNHIQQLAILVAILVLWLILVILCSIAIVLRKTTSTNGLVSWWLGKKRLAFQSTRGRDFPWECCRGVSRTFLCSNQWSHHMIYKQHYSNTEDISPFVLSSVHEYYFHIYMILWLHWILIALIKEAVQEIQ